MSFYKSFKKNKKIKMFIAYAKHKLKSGYFLLHKRQSVEKLEAINSIIGSECSPIHFFKTMYRTIVLV